MSNRHLHSDSCLITYHNPTRCSSIDRWIRNVIGIFNGILFSYWKNKITSFAPGWVKQAVLLNETSQTWKARQHMLSLAWGHQREDFGEAENKVAVTRRALGGSRERVTDRYRGTMVGDNFQLSKAQQGKYVWKQWQISTQTVEITNAPKPKTWYIY